MSYVPCPRCGYEVLVDPDEGDRKTRCPGCERKFVPDDAPRRRGGAGKILGTIGRTALAGCLGVFVVGGFLAALSLVVFLAAQAGELDEARSLYEKGRHAEAVEKYKRNFPYAGRRKAEALRAIVLFEVARDAAEAGRWVERGLDHGVDVHYGDARADAILARARVLRDEREAERREQARLGREERRAAREESLRRLRDAARGLPGDAPFGEPRYDEAVAANRRLVRQQFELLVLGKSGDEVIRLIGRPDATTNVDGRDILIYYNVSTDPATGRPQAVVELLGGGMDRIEQVNFH